MFDIVDQLIDFTKVEDAHCDVQHRDLLIVIVKIEAARCDVMSGVGCCGGTDGGFSIGTLLH